MSYGCANCGKFSFPKPAICFWCANKGMKPPESRPAPPASPEEVERLRAAKRKRDRLKRQEKKRRDDNTELF